MKPMQNWQYFLRKTEPFPELLTLSITEFELMLLQAQLNALIDLTPPYQQAWGKETSYSSSRRALYRSRFMRILGRIEEINPSLHTELSQHYSVESTIEFFQRM